MKRDYRLTNSKQEHQRKKIYSFKHFIKQLNSPSALFFIKNLTFSAKNQQEKLKEAKTQLIKQAEQKLKGKGSQNRKT